MELQRAIDEAMEIRIITTWNIIQRRKEYEVKIIGDCCLTSTDKDLSVAIHNAAKAYDAWRDATDALENAAQTERYNR
jgi:hypothetical protein